MKIVTNGKKEYPTDQYSYFPLGPEWRERLNHLSGLAGIAYSEGATQEQKDAARAELRLPDNQVFSSDFTKRLDAWKAQLEREHDTLYRRT